MAKSGILPKSWSTGDGHATAGKDLMRLAGPDSALILYGSRWWVVRYLDPSDKYRVNLFGQRREQQPWRRKLEIIGGGGRSLDEALFNLRGGQCRAMVGSGIRPVCDERGEWSGFVLADGTRVDQLPLVGPE